MNTTKALNCGLLISGLIAAGIGAAILVAPGPFYATYGIELGGDASLLSEIRAPGGALLALGLLMTIGAFVPALRFASTVVAAAVYLPYGLSRLLSMAIDGLPDTGLIGAAVLELAIGAAALVAVRRQRHMDRNRFRPNQADPVLP